MNQNQSKYFFSLKLIIISFLCVFVTYLSNQKAISEEINHTNNSCRNQNECTMNNISNESHNQAVVSGNIFYRERISLPPNSVINVKLVDISLQDTKAITIAEQEIITTGQQVPIPFELSYSPQNIKPSNTYAVQAKIIIGDKLVYISDQIYPVITRDNPQEVEILVRRVESNANTNSAYLGKWLLEDLGGIGVIDNLQTTMELTEDGKIFGTGGCNNYTGSYTIVNNEFKISPLASTFKMCTPAVMNQEDKFFQALNKVINIKRDGAFLLIESENTEKPLKFTLMP